MTKLSGFDYEYTGELEGAVPGVGLVKRGQTITPTHAEHEQAIKDSGLFKRVPRAGKEAEAADAEPADAPAPKTKKTADSGKEGNE